MSRSRLKTPLVVGAVVLVISMTRGSTTAAKDASSDRSARPIGMARADPGPRSSTDWQREETQRIQGHLERVEAWLGARPTTELDRAQRMRRSEALDWLREYRQRGRFPHNHSHGDRRVPVFVDGHGTPCAVGYLLLRAGELDLVEDVVRTDNNAYVRELGVDERLGAWLRATGLTIEEAALIQPTYGPGFPGGTVVTDSETYEKLSVGVGAVSAVAAVFSFATDPDLTRSEWLGGANAALAFGHTAMAVGGAVGEDHEPWAIALNGGMALVSGLAALHRFSRRGAPAASRSRVFGEAGPRVVLPEVAWIGGGTGLQVRIIH